MTSMSVPSHAGACPSSIITHVWGLPHQHRHAGALPRLPLCCILSFLLPLCCILSFCYRFVASYRFAAALLHPIGLLPLCCMPSRLGRGRHAKSIITRAHACPLLVCIRCVFGAYSVLIGAYSLFIRAHAG